MKDRTDHELLQLYAQHKSEPAFAELVRRHIDLVYSVALRIVHDSTHAQDVVQNVFVILAQSASKLLACHYLPAWLHRTTRNVSANIIRSETRRRHREQEAAIMNNPNLSSHPSWHQIAPHLDSALDQLSDSDREALLLRFFQRKSAAEMAQELGITETAAQKRLNRAVERLREKFAKAGLTPGTTALATILSTHAVQAAPAGLAITVCAATNLSTITLTHAIAMTTFQKTALTTSFVAALCTALYQGHEATSLRDQNRILLEQQQAYPNQLAILQKDQARMSNQIAALSAENQHLKSHSHNSELLKLRGELARLKSNSARHPNPALDPEDPTMQRFLQFKAQAEQINRLLEQMPDKKIPELALLTEEDWLTAVKNGRLDTEENIRKTFSTLRSLAKNRLPLGGALNAFLAENNGRLPTHISQLRPYISSELQKTLDPNIATSPVPYETALNAILDRYKLLHTGNIEDLPRDTWLIAEIAPVDRDYDSRAKFAPGRSTIIGTGKNSTGDPDDNSY